MLTLERLETFLIDIQVYGIQPCEGQLAFNLNDVEASLLKGIESNSLTESILGKLRFRGSIEVKP